MFTYTFSGFLRPLPSLITRTTDEVELFTLSLLESRRAQRALFVLSFVSLVLLTFQATVHAQTGTDGGNITQTLQNIAQTIYFSWRVYVTIIGLMIGAAILLFSSSPHAKTWAARIIIAAIVFALIPSLYKLISSWTGTSSTGDLGSGPGQ